MAGLFSLLGYVGPGAGMGALGALLGLLVSALLALGILLLWPVRLLLRKMGVLKPPEPQQPKPEPAAKPPEDLKQQSPESQDS
ncbi:MAG: hypothetical protein N2111_06445 [Candidatus Sumerlaeaceae bacterium]|nr:hypothetical protein [Candidatus Sumerlaeaceae bacterium]